MYFRHLNNKRSVFRVKTSDLFFLKIIEHVIVENKSVKTTFVVCLVLPVISFIFLAVGWGSGGAAAGTTTDPGSLQQHETAQDPLTCQRLPDGLKLRKI
jgi:hypothetical protein